jgi:hypothetical protein
MCRNLLGSNYWDEQEPKPAGAVAKRMPVDLDKLIIRCLRKEADHRIQHMGDLKLARL